MSKRFLNPYVFCYEVHAIMKFTWYLFSRSLIFFTIFCNMFKTRGLLNYVSTAYYIVCALSIRDTCHLFPFHSYLTNRKLRMDNKFTLNGRAKDQG